MPSTVPDPESLAPVAGVRLSVAGAGLRRGGAPDLTLMELAPGTRCTAVFTRNRFAAAPVTVARSHLTRHAPRYLLINAGNANAGTGRAGREAAMVCCRALADYAGCPVEAVLPFSTGVIGEPLPVDGIRAALPAALAGLRDDAWWPAARAIMTTDTVPKGATRRVTVAGRPVTVTGIAKGAGMIHPDMATMLAFVATDASVDEALLRTWLQGAVERSFHCITVDGDTSTNDACVLVATGAGAPIQAGDAAAAGLRQAVEAVCVELSRAIVGDAEGATRFVTIAVTGAASEAEARGVARTVALSPLVKTALYAGDPNWGRILAAVGRAGVDDLDIERVSIHLGEVCVVSGGERASDYTEASGRAVFTQPEITVTIHLGRGDAGAHIWTCDLSHDYVRINAEYRS